MNLSYGRIFGLYNKLYYIYVHQLWCSMGIYYLKKLNWKITLDNYFTVDGVLRDAMIKIL